MAKQKLNCSTKPKISTCCPFSDSETPFLERLSDQTIDLLINISIFIKNGISFYHTSNTIWYHGCEHLFYHKSSKPGAIFEVKKFSFFANFDWQKWPIVFAHSIAKWTLVLKACHIQKKSNFQQPRRISIAPLRTFCTIFYSGDRCWCGMIWWGGIYRHRLLVHGAIDSAIAVFFCSRIYDKHCNILHYILHRLLMPARLT